MRFVKPTKELNKLLILMELDNDNEITQKELADHINLAPSMVNVYIKEFVNKGYMEVSGNNRNTIYKLNLEGKKQKNFLLIDYLRELMDLQKEYREYLINNLKSILGYNCKSLILFGAGEVGVMYSDIIRCVNYTEIIGFIDDDLNKVGKEINGFKVYHFDDVDKLKFDKILVSTFIDVGGIYNRLKTKIPEKSIITLIDVNDESPKF